MNLQQPFIWEDFSGGNMQAVTSAITSSQSLQVTLPVKTSVPFSINLVYQEELGNALSRLGTSIVGNQIASGFTCQGLFQHIDNLATNNKLIAGFNGTIFDVLGGNPMPGNSGNLNPTAQMKFATYLNNTLMLNGTDLPRSYSAAGGWTTAGGGTFDLSNIPVGAQNPIEFLDSMYCTVGDTLYFSNVSSPTAIGWTALGSGSLLVSNEDGGGLIQGLAKVPGYLLIFKQHSLKRWDGTSTYPTDLVTLGTQSGNSIVYGQSTVYFFYGPKGFFATQGQFPILISRPVQRIIDGINPNFYSQINGWCDNQHVYWSVGTVTVNFGDGYVESYTNVVLRYTIDTQQWAVLRYGHLSYQMTKYVNNGTISIVNGDNNGNILMLNNGNSDYGNLPISFILQSQEFDFGFRDKMKIISEKIIVNAYNSDSAILQVLINRKGNWLNVGPVRGPVTEVKVKQKLTGNIFEFRLVGMVTGHQVRLRGLIFPTTSVDIQEGSTLI
jgi:hypothetical protein